MTDGSIDDLIAEIFEGIITPHNLPIGLYNELVAVLKGALYEGYGGDLTAFEGKDLELLKELRTNVYHFSAAKTFAQVTEMSELMASQPTRKEFFEAAKTILGTYNKTYLNTEKDTAYGQAQMAVKWQAIERDKVMLPLLRYNAVMERNTCPICQGLHDLVAPVDSPIWKRVSPLNHYSCRCILDQLMSGEEPITYNGLETAEEVQKLMQPAFLMNPGIDGYVFSPKHPVFEVDSKDKAFQRNNYNLPLPKKD